MSSARPRKSPSNSVRARLQKEIGSICPFCPDEDVAHFEVHHIDSDRSNDDIANLLMICRKCHSKITKGEFSDDKVRKKKLLMTARRTAQAPLGQMFTRREREFSEYAFSKLDHMVRVPVVRQDVDELAAKAWQRGYWDVKVSFLALVLWCYQESPQRFSFFEVLCNLRFETATNLGSSAIFQITDWAQNILTPEPLMEQLGFIRRPSINQYVWLYTRSMHQFALWLDANRMAPRLIEAEWIRLPKGVDE